MFKDSFGVVHQTERRGSQGADVARIHTAWAEQAKVQPDRGGARAPVEGECHRAVGAAVVSGVRDEEDLRLRFKTFRLAVFRFFAAQDEPAGGCCVGET